jgi:hypothetical protein
MVDFGALTPPDAAGALVDPRDVFAALPGRAAGYNHLRGHQDQVLSQWFANKDRRDNVVKLNTGGGKSIVALLIAQSSLNEGVGPVAILAGDSHLKRRLTEEAANLGIAVVNDADDHRYSSSRAILVDTFDKVFNGFSTFGVGGSIPKTARNLLGTVIVDDAHACVAKAEQAVFRLHIPKGTDIHGKLLALVEPVLAEQHPAGLDALKLDVASAALQVPHWAWYDRRRDITTLLTPLLKQEPRVWPYPLIADVLGISRAVFSPDGLDISAPCPNVELLTGFRDARRRVFLTATLADDSVLVQTFNADAVAVADPIVPANAGDIGDRLILMPAETHPDTTEDEVRQLVSDLAKDRTVVVIVPSRLRAAPWVTLGASVYDKDSIDEGVELMKTNPTSGLVVLLNRYDGVDLPGDVCHVLVIDGLPEALDAIDRLDEQQLTGSDALLATQVQRIEQGMGRAVRSNDDHCVVLLLGNRLTHRLHRPGARAIFSPATREQLRLSEQVAGMLTGTGLDALRDAVKQVLDRDATWLAATKATLAPLRYDSVTVDPVTVERRAAFEHAAHQEYPQAVRRIEAALKHVIGDKVRRGMLMQELSVYQHPTDPAAAQTSQAAANQLNRSLLRPIGGSAYKPLTRPAQQQGAAASSFLVTQYESAAELRIGLASLVNDLVFGSRTNAFEDAVALLADHLGWHGQRPEQETGAGPDNLWALGDASFLIIEDKSDAKEHPVFKRDAEQLSNSVDWFKGRYGTGVAFVPVLVHPWAKFDKHAAVPAGCRVVTTEKLEQLRATLNDLAVALAAGDAYRDPVKVGQLLADKGLTVLDLLKRYTVAARQAT